MIILELYLHVGPTVLNGIEIRGVPGPVHDGELLLKGPQVLHHLLALVAGGSILQEESGLVDPHEGYQVVLQDRLNLTDLSSHPNTSFLSSLAVLAGLSSTFFFNLASLLGELMRGRPDLGLGGGDGAFGGRSFNSRRCSLIVTTDQPNLSAISVFVIPISDQHIILVFSSSESCVSLPIAELSAILSDFQL